MTEDKLKQSIHQAIERATVKIFVDSGFMGTGFFITSDGYVLTAYHCIRTKQDIKEGYFPEKIQIQLISGETLEAQLDYAKSVPDDDIAVLKVDNPIEHCLPLSLIITEEERSYCGSDVVSRGYPNDKRHQSESVGTYSGTISRFLSNNKIETDVIAGTGQSGAALYYDKTHRVIGIVLEIDKPDEVTRLGMAVRLDSLFKGWPELQKITAEVAKDWDERLKQLGVTSPSEKVQNQGVANVTQTIHNHGEINKQIIIGHINGTVNI